MGEMEFSRNKNKRTGVKEVLAVFPMLMDTGSRLELLRPAHHFMDSSWGTVLTTEIYSLSLCDLLFKAWPASLLLNLINFSTIKSHEEKHPH